MALSPFGCLMVYSTLIITSPVFAFFATKPIAEMLWTNDGNTAAAVVSVIVLHVVLFAFVYRAFQEESTSAAIGQQKKD